MSRIARCKRCFEPSPCLKCVEVKQYRSPWPAIRDAGRDVRGLAGIGLALVGLVAVAVSVL